jgi:hypothetical protein
LHLLLPRDETDRERILRLFAAALARPAIVAAMRLWASKSLSVPGALCNALSALAKRCRLVSRLVLGNSEAKNSVA